MESQLGALNLNLNQITTRFFGKTCEQNKLSDCWHCFKCEHEGHIARLSCEKGKLVTVTGDWGNHITDTSQMPPIISTDVNIEEKNVNIGNLK